MARTAVKILLVAAGYIAVTASSCCEELPPEEQDACLDFFDFVGGFPEATAAPLDAQPQLAAAVEPSASAQAQPVAPVAKRGDSCS